MNKEDLYRSIGAIDDDILSRSEKSKSHSNKHLRYIAAVACCLTAILALSLLAPRSASKPVRQWSENYAPADYFAYNKKGDDVSSSKASIADSAIPYAAMRYFSGHRIKLESEGVIPVMADYPLFDCIAYYNDDLSLQSVTFTWHRRGGDYSDLSITVGYEEVEIIQDCIDVELDDKGNIIPEAVTVTERDGIKIVAEGNPNKEKTITYENPSGWYQIKGSWNDSYEPVAALLDWVWEHPVDLARFPIEAGDEIVLSDLNSHPDAFKGYIPDFNKFGFTEGDNYLTQKNGEPYSFEGHYIAHADASKVQDGTYSDTDGWTEIHWCIDTEPDYYDVQESLGELKNLTEATVAETLSESSHITFTWDDYLIKVYTNTPEETWQVLQSLIK